MTEETIVTRDTHNMAPHKPDPKIVETTQDAVQASGNLLVFDLNRLAHFQPGKPFVQVLSDIATTRVVLLTFRSGQQLKEHKTGSQLLVQVVRGHVTFTTEESSIELQAGMLLQLEAHIPHSVVAMTDAILLLIMTISPSLQHQEQAKL